jgi:hypothetical protein
MRFGDKTAAENIMRHANDRRPIRRALLAVAAALLSLGCSTATDVVADDGRADSNAVAKAVDAGEIAAWRVTVARLRGDLAEVAEDSSASGEQTHQRLEELTDELASLERRIAKHEVAAAANPVTANKPAGGESQSDGQVAPAHLEVPLGQPLPKHPFLPAVKRARAALAEMESIEDYSAVLVKQIRLDGKLYDMEFMHAKIRHEPFSVYLRFLAPQDKRDREVIYVAGQNDGNLLAHESPHRKGLVGLLSQTPLVGTTSLAPTSPLAMIGNRYPITTIGIVNLTRELVEVGEKDMRHGGAEAKYFPNAKVEDRECEAFVFIHPEQRKEFTFHRAEVFIDKKLNVPIRYVSYGWPEMPGETPPLIESYTYTRLKLNVGLSDEDFDTKNPKYRFPQ